ncbi:MAG: XdhC family protein, partial [Actinomycetota bacterium]
MTDPGSPSPTEPWFARYAELLDAEQPVALITVIEGPNVGAKLLVTTDGDDPIGTLGHPELDRVAARDAVAELE